MIVYPPIPEDGLAEVLGGWAGRGYIWDAMAAPAAVRDERDWNRRDVIGRAHRVLLERIAPSLRLWPSRLSAWVDALPAARVQARTVKTAPFAGVSWPATRTVFGWPPSGFIGRETERSADTLLVTALRWTLDYFFKVHANAVRAFPDVDIGFRDQVKAASDLLLLEPVASSQPTMPGRPEILALRREGRPWAAIASVAAEFRAIESSLLELAWRLILPDEGIRWRLFHLSVLGILLGSLRDQGCKIVSRRPLGGSTAGPNYSVTDSQGLSWDLWFEAASVFGYEGEDSPYGQITEGIPGMSRALGADLLLIQPAHKALIIECKYSADRNNVARNGYLQAVTYAAEIKSRLGGSAVSLVVGPEGVIPVSGFTDMCVGRVGLVPPKGIAAEVHSILSQA